MNNFVFHDPNSPARRPRLRLRLQAATATGAVAARTRQAALDVAAKLACRPFTLRCRGASHCGRPAHGAVWCDTYTWAVVAAGSGRGRAGARGHGTQGFYASHSRGRAGPRCGSDTYVASAAQGMRCSLQTGRTVWFSSSCISALTQLPAHNRIASCLARLSHWNRCNTAKPYCDARFERPLISQTSC